MIRHVFYLCASLTAAIGVLSEDMTAVGVSITLAVLTVAEELYTARLEQRRNARAVAELWLQSLKSHERERP